MAIARGSVVLFCTLLLGLAGSASAQRPTSRPRGRMGGGGLTPYMVPGTRQFVNITQFGAVGDGKTMNTIAIQRALNACAISTAGGDVTIPAGNFLTGSILIGPRTTIRFEEGAILTGSPNRDDYPTTNVRWEGEWRPGHRALIAANDVDHIAIVGPGKIVGPPTALASLRPNRNGEVRGPSIIEPINCRDVILDGFAIKYQRMWTVHLTYCQDVIARNLNIRTILDNGDGIDVDSCRNVLIEGCDIESGDDSIVLKSGRGLEGVTIARPTEDVIIRNCKLACPNFGALGFGTEMSGGIRNVQVSHCSFDNSYSAIFIKSRAGRAGFMENLSFDDIEATDKVSILVNIDLLKCGIEGANPIEGVDGLSHVGNLKFSHVKSAARTLFLVDTASQDKPIDNVSLSDFSGTCQDAIRVSHINNFSLENINVAGYAGPFLRMEQVTGPNLAQIREPKDTIAARQ